MNIYLPYIGVIGAFMSYIGVIENIGALAGLHVVFSGFGKDEMN